MVGVETNGETGSPISEENKALIQFGANSIIESVNTIKDFIKTMVPLTTALITAYLALLQFIGTNSSGNTVNGQDLLLPPCLMLVALIVFILSSFPVPKKITLGNIQSIKSYRNSALCWKYSTTIAGCFFFVLGVACMILILT